MVTNKVNVWTLWPHISTYFFNKSKNSRCVCLIPILNLVHIKSLCQSTGLLTALPECCNGPVVSHVTGSFIPLGADDTACVKYRNPATLALKINLKKKSTKSEWWLTEWADMDGATVRNIMWGIKLNWMRFHQDWQKQMEDKVNPAANTHTPTKHRTSY